MTARVSRGSGPGSSGAVRGLRGSRRRARPVRLAAAVEPAPAWWMRGSALGVARRQDMSPVQPASLPTRPQQGPQLATPPSVPGPGELAHAPYTTQANACVCVCVCVCSHTTAFSSAIWKCIAELREILQPSPPLVKGAQLAQAGKGNRHGGPLRQLKVFGRTAAVGPTDARCPP